jgi:hypothetical protein
VSHAGSRPNYFRHGRRWRHYGRYQQDLIGGSGNLGHRSDIGALPRGSLTAPVMIFNHLTSVTVGFLHPTGRVNWACQEPSSTTTIFPLPENISCPTYDFSLPKTSSLLSLPLSSPERVCCTRALVIDCGKLVVICRPLQGTRQTHASSVYPRSSERTASSPRPRPI